MARSLRVGTVPYLVARPLDAGLEGEAGIELRRAVPADLVRGLRARELDVALCSSIELFRRPGYRWIDGLAVAGRGPVDSVQVFLRRPLDRVQSVALDPASRAAAALVRIALAEWRGLRPELIRAEGDPRETPADAWLRIGDDALRERLAANAPPSFDPAACWTEETGLPFPFAVWIVRPEVAIEPHLAAFFRARDRGAERAGELADEAAAGWSLPVAACRRYLLEQCVYEPGPELPAAVQRFGELAVRHELAPRDASTNPARIARGGGGRVP